MVFLLLGLGAAALLDRRRAAYFRSPAPWVTIAVGALALAPHAAWLVANDFVPFSYAIAGHGPTSLASALRGALGYLAGAVGYVAVPIVIVFAAARPGRATIKEMGWPVAPQRRLAALAFWAPLLLPPLIAIFTRIRLTSLWTMSAWSLLPAMLLSSPLVGISHRDAVRVLALAVLLPFVMVAVAPAIAFGIHRAGPAPDAALSSVLVEPIEQLWRKTTDRPLKVFAGYDDLTDGVAFYMRSHPLAAHVLDGPILPAMEQRIGHEGIVLLCPAHPRDRSSAASSMNAATSLAARFPRGKQTEVEVSRPYLGVHGVSARYLLFAIPPRQP
jgi:4-amino-4-deoxy-L-arabinose transferase-like glycosyltransferase